MTSEYGAERSALKKVFKTLKAQGVEAGDITSPAPLGEEVTYESFVAPGPEPVVDLTGRPISNDDPDTTWTPSQGSTK